MLEYLIYLLKCLGCISAIVVILFLNIQIIYVQPKEKKKIEKAREDMLRRICNEATTSKKKSKKKD